MAASQHKWYLCRARHIPKSCRILFVDALPSYKQSKCSEIFTNKQSWKYRAPSMTILILPTRPCTTLNVWATVIRASSWVNRSNLWRTASISLSPSSFLVNFSAAHILSNGQCMCDMALTEPPLFNLFRCKGEHRK